MRTFDHAMTKAAFDRLRLLKDPATLAIPLDAALMRPFDIRFEGDTLCVSHNGRDLMYVGEFVKPTGARAVLTYPDNEEVDRLMRRLLTRATRHLDECHRITSAEKREQAAERAALEAEKEAAREEEARRNPAFDGVRAEVSAQLTIPKSLFNEAKRAKTDAEWGYSHDQHGHGPQTVRMYHRGMFLSFDYHERVNEVVLTPKAGNQIALDETRFIAALEQRAARVARISDPERIRRAFEALPIAEYSCAMAAMKSPQRDLLPAPHRTDVGDEACFIASANSVSLLIEDVSVLVFRIKRVEDTVNIPKDDSHCVCRRAPAPFLRNIDVPEATREQEVRIGSLWAAFRAEWLGIDPDLFRSEAAALPEVFEDDTVDQYWL